MTTYSPIVSSGIFGADMTNYKLISHEDGRLDVFGFRPDFNEVV